MSTRQSLCFIVIAAGFTYTLYAKYRIARCNETIRLSTLRQTINTTVPIIFWTLPNIKRIRNLKEIYQQYDAYTLELCWHMSENNDIDQQSKYINSTAIMRAINQKLEI